jgi:putative redox protein
MAEAVARWISGKQVEVVTQGHTWTVDEPVERGGEGLGPSPLGLLRGALAACTVVTVLDVAAANTIPIEGLEVEVDSVMGVHAAESKLSWERRLRISRLRRRITVRGAVTEEQQALLLQGAEWCPVDRTLARGVAIETTIARWADSPGSEAKGGER